MSTSQICNPPERRHIEVGREPRECAHHGGYEAVLWQLDPPPTPHSAHAKLAPEVWHLGPRWSSCPKCDADLQAVADARDAEIRGGMPDKERADRERWRGANVPKRFIDSTLWNWQHGMDQQERVWHWARSYCETMTDVLNTGRCGVLVGATGTGKTHLAIGILKQFLKQGGTGYYTTAIDMLGRIKATYHDRAEETETQVVDMLTSRDLLVLDEVGRQLDTSYEIAQLFRVLDRRSADLRPTIVISNLGPAGLKSFLGEHVFDRLAEHGGRMLALDWASHRRRKAPPKREREA